MEIIQNEQERGLVFANKLSVAKRQLDAAIRMYFAGEDSIAVHTVASAAFNVFSDLLEKRGKDASVHGFIYGAIRAAKDLREGKLTEDDIRSWGEGALDLVRSYDSLFDEDPDVDIDQVTGNAPQGWARQFWLNKREAYNFVKHADRDADGLLDEASINNEDILMHALVCAQHLNLKISSEAYFFFCSMIVLGKLEGGMQRKFDLEVVLRGLSVHEIAALARRNLCKCQRDEDAQLLEAASQKMKSNLDGADFTKVLFVQC